MFKLLVLLAVLLLSAHSWGACAAQNTRICEWANSGSCPSVSSCGGSGYYWTSFQGELNCGALGAGVCGCTYNVRCSSSSEADSLNCELNPADENCSVEIDTTLWACTEGVADGSTYSELYLLSCRAKNGVVVSCNGKTNIDVSTDGQFVRRMQGTCAANGYNNGIQDGGDDVPTAQCIAAIGSNCYMRDVRSGNTFNCACDGDCEHAIRQMATGGCVNPYPQDTLQNDSLTLPFSSSSDDWPLSSSAAEPSSSESFSNELEGIEKIYGVLDTIRDTLNRKIAPSVLDIQANVQNIGNQMLTANDWLQQIAGKDWNPTINVGSPDVIIEGDTNIINVTNNTDVSGIEFRQDRQFSSDTAYQRRVLGVMGALTDTAGVGNPNDTAGSGAALAARLASIDSAVDALNVSDMSDSIAPTLQALRGDVMAMRDSIAGGAVGDSVNAWGNAFLNNGVLTGNGSNNCPAPLTRQVVFTFPHVGTIQAGTLGRYLCTPIAGFSVTLWQVARLLLRAMVAIGCMWWLFKEVTGTATGGSNDDE